MPDGISFQDFLKPSPVGISFEDFLKPSAATGDNLPWDVPMTGAQMRAAQEQTQKGEEAISGLPWPLRAAARGGQQLLGERPPPTPLEALEEASLGAPLGVRKFVSAARTAETAAQRVEPSPPSAGGPAGPTTPGLTLEEFTAPVPARPSGQPTVELGGVEVGQSPPSPWRAPTTPEPAVSLEEAGLKLPEAATGTETVEVPQADGTVVQVRVQTGEAPPIEPPAPTEAPPEAAPTPEPPAAEETPPPVSPGAEPTSEPATPPVQAYGGPWTPALTDKGEPAKNPDGAPIYENPNGTRALMENGVPYTEPVTQTETGMAPKSPDKRKPQFQTEAEAKPAAEPKPKPKTAEKPPEPKSEWELLGKNADGVDVYKNAQGVHSTLKDGVRSIEPVRMRPTRTGMEMSVPEPSAKDPEYQVVTPKEEDTAGGNKAPSAEAGPATPAETEKAPTEAEAKPAEKVEPSKHSMAKTQAEFEKAYHDQQHAEPPLSARPEYLKQLADQLDALPDTVLGKKRLIAELEKGPDADRDVIRNELDRLVEGDHIAETPFVRAVLLGEQGGYSPQEMRQGWLNYQSYVYPQSYIDKAAANPRDLKHEIDSIKRQMAIPKGERDPIGDGPPISAVERMAMSDNLAALEQRRAANDQKEHPGLRIKSLETGKETVIQPIGTVPSPTPPTPEPEQPKTLEEALAAADAAHKAYFPTFQKAQADYLAKKIGDDEYFKARRENDRLKDAWDKLDRQLRDKYDAEAKAEADKPLHLAFAEGRSPVPEPGEAYKGMAPPNVGNVRGQDGKGNTWVGTGVAMVRQDADKGFMPMAARGEARKKVPHRLTGIKPEAFDSITNDAGSDAQVTWKRTVTGPTEGKDYVIGTTPQGRYVIMEKPYFDLISRAAGPDGTLSTKEPVKASKDTSTAPVFARRPDGTVVGVGMPIRWLERAARIMATGTDGETVPVVAPPAPKAAQPSDTPAATGKPELNSGDKENTSPTQEGSDAANDGKPTSGDGGLGKPGSGSIRSSGSRAGSGGRKGRDPKLAPASTDDVAPAGGMGNPGQDGVRPEPEVPGSDEPIPDSGDATDGRPGAGGEGVDEPGAGGRPGPELDLSKPKEPKAPMLKGREVDLPDATRPNFFISEPERMVGGGDKARFNRNRRAIEAFQSITEEGREPTEEELETMAGFTGWGSFGQDLFQGTFERQPPRPGWDVEAQWLRNHLGKVAWDAAHNSISNAHYTDPPTVEAMWNMVRQMGFKGGRVLEPSMGIGNFFGLMPRDLMAQSTLTGIELDPTTGGMAKLLYPEAGVFVKGFQESKTPDNFYDLVIGNWPFDATPPADRRYNRLKPTLHDYFYLKALDQTRPGGLVIGITSAGTMDKMDRLARMEMAKKGELVAAFRLPTGAFEKYAGTKVVTDIVILRKRAEPLQDPSNEPWINTKDMDTPAGEPIRVNQYYHDHPENVLGTFDYGHGTTTFRPGMLVHRPENMMERLQSLPETLPTDAYRPITRGDEPRFITSNAADRLNSVVIGNDGNLYQVAGERLLRLEDVFKGMGAGTQKLQKERSDQVRALVGMRKAYGALIDAERDGRPDVEDLRKALSDQYKAYNQTKTKMIDTPGMKVLDRVKDPNWPILAALQRPDGTPALILSQSVVRPRRQIGNPSVADAYVMARNEAVTLNMERIAELSGRTVDEAAQSLLNAGAVFRTPGGGYEPSDGYLSGNVRLKLREAQDAVERGEPMEGSVEALTKVIPKNTPYYQIEAKLGSSWVSPKDYQQFIAEQLLDLPEDRWPEVDVTFLGSRWNVGLAGRLNNTVEANQTHGHPRYRFDRLLTAAMGNTSPRIMDPRDKDGGPYYNAKASEEVATRIQEVREKFQDWIWKDAERTVRLEAAFNEALNAVAKPHFDGSFMDMSGMALLRGDAPFDMRRHQANGIWRGISLRRGLFAHEVGTGKTYTIGGIAIEGRRYGRWNKPMLIAHNANSKSVARDIQAMYPGAKVLSIDSDDLTPKTLKQSMYSIRNEDWDLVVVQHSHLNRFALKKETLMGLAREQITAIEDEMYAAAAEDGDNLGNVNLTDEKDIEKKIKSITAKQLAKQRLKILNKIEEQGQRASREDAIPFEDLGIDCILVDEAHVFKKPPIATRMRVKGLNTEASAMSIGLDFLTKYIKNNNNGNNVFLFTGTPVTNSLNEIFNMSKYFMDDVLKRDGIGDWDPWFNTFANALNDVELVSTGDYETIRRLSAFDNVDELVRVMSQFTDVVQASDMPEFVDRSTPSGKTLSSPDLTPEDRDFLENGRTENPIGRPYKRIINDVSEILPEQAIIQAELRDVIRNFKQESPRFRKENRHIPVVVEGQMSNASLDPRMHDPDLEENPNNKINRVTKNVLEIYQTPKAAQMIFLDNGYNPGKRNPNFSVVDALVDKLVKGGIPRNEIAIVAGGLEPDQKAQIAADMNSGKIRVAIGQSNTLGVGVNAQDNLRAMHHMDAPWMPGELEQRDGRGHRAGNAWNTVLEYRYITEGLDGKRWQVLTIKDRFIKQFINAFNDESGKRIGSIEGDAADISEKEDIVGTLSAAAGDPRLMQREKLRSDVNRLQRREQQHTYGVADAQRRARQTEGDIVSVTKRRAGQARLVNVWVAAQDRIEAEAKEAGAKVRWYDAVIDGVPVRTSSDIQDALDKRIGELAQAEGKVKIGTINGFGIESDWPKGWTEPSFYLTNDKGDLVGGTGMSVLSVQRIVGRIQAIKNDAENIAGLDQMKSDVEKLKKAAEQPFTQAEALLKKRQQLAKLEDDLAENPIPPPAWLRHGAAIDTPIWVDGQERIVRGHRMSDDYYVITDEGDVPYMKVTDKNGFNTFTQKPPPPKLAKELPQWAGPFIAAAGFGSPTTGSMAEGAEVIWHGGDLVLIKGRRDGETMFLGFKKGLSEDRQAHDIYGTRGAFEVKDIERMRKEAEAYRDREENKRNLEKAEKRDQAELIRGGHSRASGRYISAAWSHHLDDLEPD